MKINQEPKAEKRALQALMEAEERACQVFVVQVAYEQKIYGIFTLREQAQHLADEIGGQVFSFKLNSPE